MSATVGIALASGWIVGCGYLRHRRNSFMRANVEAALAARRGSGGASASCAGHAAGAEDKCSDECSAKSSDQENTGRESSRIGESTWRVHNLLTGLEFVFEAWTAMSVRGLFLTYGIPSISATLQKTGGFSKDASRRYADMELLIREFNESAVDGTTDFDGQPERAKIAIMRLNAIHQEYSHLISYRDMVYVLVVFATSPGLWMGSRWSWRRLSRDELACIFYQWSDIGTLMGLDIRTHFTCWDDMLVHKRAYEAKYMRYAESNQIVFQHTVEFFLNGVVPHWMHTFVRPAVLQVLSCLQETSEHAAALGLPRANPVVSACVDVVLTVRAYLRFLLPPRPFRWFERLTGHCPVIAKEAGGGCPMVKMYHPTRGLDFNNTTYDDSRAYTVQNMGPRHVEPGRLCESPKYLGDEEKKIL